MYIYIHIYNTGVWPAIWPINNLVEHLTKLFGHLETAPFHLFIPGAFQVELGEKKQTKKEPRIHQKLNGTESQRTPKKVTRAIKYPGLGVCSVGPTVGNVLERNKPSDTFH